MAREASKRKVVTRKKLSVGNKYNGSKIYNLQKVWQKGSRVQAFSTRSLKTLPVENKYTDRNVLKNYERLMGGGGHDQKNRRRSVSPQFTANGSNPARVSGMKSADRGGFKEYRKCINGIVKNPV